MPDFDLPDDFNTAVDGSLTTGAAKLPFPTIPMYWKNGSIGLSGVAEIADARRFGGWAIDKEKSADILLPAWTLHSLTGESNNRPYEVYLVRGAWVAPVIRRYRWLTSTKFNGSQVEYLCVLGIAPEPTKPVEKFGLAVLSSKRLGTLALDACFEKFTKASSAGRGKTAINFFYVPIGTWGAEPKFEKREGKGGSTSMVTPPQLREPQGGYTADKLKQIFVSKAVAAEIVAMHGNPDVKVWADDWNKRKNQVAEDAQAESVPEQHKEDIPF